MEITIWKREILAEPDSECPKEQLFGKSLSRSSEQQRTLQEEKNSGIDKLQTELHCVGVREFVGQDSQNMGIWEISQRSGLNHIHAYSC